MTSPRSFEITPPAELGGGWRLRLLEDGQEAGGGVFPIGDSDGDAAHAVALQDDEAWTSPTSGRASR
jgi:hypothetical protein